MDAEPPRIVLQHAERCVDGARAAELLQQALAPSRAPGQGWVVTMRAESTGATAEAEIHDPAGTAVGRRVLPRTTGDCSGAARALGLWATLVLDAETQRAAHDEASPAPPASTPSATPPSAPAEAPPSTMAVAVSGGEGTPWPAPAESEKPPAEADWYVHHEDTRSLELGAGAFLLVGTVGGAILGPTAFVVIEAGNGIFLRPSVAAGQTVTSLPDSGPRSTLAAARFDACLRLPGFYALRQGLQLEGCAGGDLGVSWLDTPTQQTVPYVAIGPSIDLRGELGALAFVIRGVFGVNLVRPSFADDQGAQEQPPALTGRIELAFSWSLR